MSEVVNMENDSQKSREIITKIGESLKTIDKCLSTFTLQQRIIMETSRKTVNSIMVIFNRLAKNLNWSAEELSNILVKGNAYTHTLGSTDAINVERIQIDWKNYPVDQLKSILIRLVKQIDLYEQKLSSENDTSEELNIIEIHEGRIKVEKY